ncbi:unnamed protein product (mitochondrion) [Plasmodiophora brassicae]|uniref:Uncharacterized protein n=1 Tax=Plasmodiophora brassicae TaxID=37360 RepID=A0A3P3Y601_PLABS|nr:unnamed protein product [Plasmodiophora brassicae]
MGKGEGKGGARLGKFLKGSGTLYDPVDLLSPTGGEHDDERSEGFADGGVDGWPGRPTLSSRVASWFTQRVRRPSVKYEASSPARRPQAGRILLDALKTKQQAERHAGAVRNVVPHRALRGIRSERLQTVRRECGQKMEQTAQSTQHAQRTANALGDEFAAFEAALRSASMAHNAAVGRLTRLEASHRKSLTNDIEVRIDRAISEGLGAQDFTVEQRIRDDEDHVRRVAAEEAGDAATAIRERQRAAAQASEQQLEAMRNAYLTKLADLEAAFEAEQVEHAERMQRISKTYEQLEKTDAALTMEIVMKERTLERVRRRYDQLREAYREMTEVANSNRGKLRSQVEELTRFYHQLQATVAHWRRTADARLRELSMTTFQARTKIRGFANKADRLLRRYTVVSKMVDMTEPGLPLQRRIDRCAMDTVKLKANLEAVRQENRQLVDTLTKVAFRKGTHLHSLLATKNLQGTVEPVQRLARSRSSMI